MQCKHYADDAVNTVHIGQSICKLQLPFIKICYLKMPLFLKKIYNKFGRGYITHKQTGAIHQSRAKHQTYNNITLSSHICGDAKIRSDL